MTKQRIKPGDSLPAAQLLDLRLDTLELIAMSLATEGDPGGKVGDAIPDRVWESLFDRDLLRQGRDITDEAYTYATPEGIELLHRSIADLASQTEPTDA